MSVHWFLGPLAGKRWSKKITMVTFFDHPLCDQAEISLTFILWHFIMLIVILINKKIILYNNYCHSEKEMLQYANANVSKGNNRCHNRLYWERHNLFACISVCDIISFFTIKIMNVTICEKPMSQKVKTVTVGKFISSLVHWLEKGGQKRSDPGYFFFYHPLWSDQAEMN